jgi:hypothetical protein
MHIEYCQKRVGSGEMLPANAVAPDPADHNAIVALASLGIEAFSDSTLYQSPLAETRDTMIYLLSSMIWRT